ncbi:DNA helicase mcm9 [Ilyodon furcidens]|uniref:DNA helicase n=1 Tax=Ilyodon furcidens TaxID=33524 RepID=A0ABV0UA21_9TELE
MSCVPGGEQRSVQCWEYRLLGLCASGEQSCGFIAAFFRQWGKPFSIRDTASFGEISGSNSFFAEAQKVLEYERDYICTKCRHVFKVQADFDQFYTFVQPVGCPNPVGCNSSKFSCLSEGSEPAACRDYQEIKIQEQVQRLSVGSIPRSLVVVLEDDLVDSCKSGDDITVYGVMCLRWKPFYDGSPCDVELVLRANNIEANNQQAAADLLGRDVQEEFEEFWDSYKQNPLAGRNEILLSLCPQVFGMYVIKLAVAMVLAGGVPRIDSSGTKVRGISLLLPPNQHRNTFFYFNE